MNSWVKGLPDGSARVTFVPEPDDRGLIRITPGAFAELMREAGWQPVEESTVTVAGALAPFLKDRRPHSRACGLYCPGHDSGQCASDCPTCSADPAFREKVRARYRPGTLPHSRLCPEPCEGHAEAVAAARTAAKAGQ